MKYPVIFNELRDIVKADMSQSAGGDKSSTPCVCVYRLHNLFYVAVEDVSEDLAPYVGLGTAADDADILHAADL